MADELQNKLDELSKQLSSLKKSDDAIVLNSEKGTVKVITALITAGIVALVTQSFLMRDTLKEYEKNTEVQFAKFSSTINQMQTKMEALSSFAEQPRFVKEDAESLIQPLSTEIRFTKIELEALAKSKTDHESRLRKVENFLLMWDRIEKPGSFRDGIN